MSTRTFPLKLYGFVAAGVLVAVAFARVNTMVRQQTVGRTLLMQSLGEMERLDEALGDEILRAAFFLYHNYDRIHAAARRLDAAFAELERRHREVNGAGHRKAEELLGRYWAAVERKRKEIPRFLTVNAVVKNASMYIPMLLRKYVETTHRPLDTAYLDRITNVASRVFLVRNGLDRKALTRLRALLAVIRAMPPPADPRTAAIHRALLGHIEAFTAAFPRYIESLDVLMQPASVGMLRELRRHYAAEDRARLRAWKILSRLLLAAFAAAVALVVVLFVRNGRASARLVKLQQSLLEAASTDQLTGLPNRFAFGRDLDAFRAPMLLLCNINGFKHVNSFYGTRIGDAVLCAVADRISRFVVQEFAGRCYRLGGDDFGVLIEQEAAGNPDLVAQWLIQILEDDPIVCEDQTVALTVSIGLSSQPPLLETAGMALLQVKRQPRYKYLAYSDDLDTSATVAANLATLASVRHAVENDGVLVFFQPIVDNRTGTVAKYECLMRLRREDGHILTPAAFLEVAKASAYYPAMTRAVVEKAFTVFRGLRCGFSINLTTTDILDPGIHEFLFARLVEEPELARRLTVEILESEGVGDYETVARFVALVKERGVSVAVDDFGAGYANFAHVLRLGIDTVKIDASLVKRLDTDTSAQALVRAVVAFCRELGIATVAEFVHSEAVHRAVCELGIDYSQGYFLGRPSPSLSASCLEP